MLFIKASSITFLKYSVISTGMPLHIHKTTVFPVFVYFIGKVLVRSKVLKDINNIKIYNKSFSIKTFDVHHKLEQSCNSGQEKHYVTHCCDVITDVIQHSNILKHYDTWKIFTSCHLYPNNILEAKRFLPHIPTCKSVSFITPAYELHQEDSVSLATIQTLESQDNEVTSKEHELLERSCKSRLSIQP